MSRSSTDQYLEAKVLTASQPKLHLMLIEGALRFGQQARQSWDDNDADMTSDHKLLRIMDILEELTMSAAAGKSDISRQLEEQYAFLYREVAASRINRDCAKLDQCLKLLEYQRETWQLACEKVASEPTPARAPVVPTHLLSSTTDTFSLEA